MIDIIAGMNVALTAHDVHVWHRLTDAIGPDEHAESLNVLSAEERDRASRFVFERDRVIYAAAHHLLRRALSRYEDVAPAEWTLFAPPNGKPVLGEEHAACGLRFNLSHTRGLVACAVSRTADVGIDVEMIDDRANLLDLANRFFSPSEASGLRECPDAERPARFIELWTLKESYVKAIGEGLSHPLDTFSFVFSAPESIRFDAPPGGDPAAWQFALYAPSDRHRMAVAVRRPEGAPLNVTVRGQLPWQESACILTRFTS